MADQADGTGPRNRPWGRRRDFVNVDHARDMARRVLPRMVFDFVDGGATDEYTLADNRRAYRELLLSPSMARDVGTVDTSVTVFGRRLSAPVLFAPCGMLGAVHPVAEPAVARVAERVGTVGVHSTYSNHSIEQIASVADRGRWFQLYFMGGRAGAEAMIERAARSGYEALVVTVDTAVPGRRERDTRNGVTYPVTVDVASALRYGPAVALRPTWLARMVRAGFPVHPANIAGGGPDDAGGTGGVDMFDRPPCWEDLSWIREAWPGPLVIKGVIGVDDAIRAADHGVDALIVSNHGGRQLDGVPASLRMLPGIVDAVGADLDVMIDGGVRRGSDVVKALALGARAVLIGRPYIWGLAVGGEAGVQRVWDLLVEELAHTMTLLGRGTVPELDPSVLVETASVAMTRTERSG